MGDKVYLVSLDSYDSNFVLGIYTTPENAASEMDKWVADENTREHRTREELVNDPDFESDNYDWEYVRIDDKKGLPVYKRNHDRLNVHVREIDAPCEWQWGAGKPPVTVMTTTTTPNPRRPKISQ